MITIIIPTLNEEKNVGFVTKIIDKGLVKYSGVENAKLYNVDGGSQDKTRANFMNTKTKIAKKSLMSDRRMKGKGANLIKGIRTTQISTDYFLVIDADIKSIQPFWVKKFINPVCERKADIVIPIYTRNKYEGNATNHFSTVIIYSLFGLDIPQPIAGDFAFNKKLSLDILKNKLSDSDYKYGIDTLITWTAILNNYRITQVRLGQKIHNPSFIHIKQIFEDVANTTFNLINKNRRLITKMVRDEKEDKTRKLLALIADKSYSSKPDKSLIDRIQEDAVKFIQENSNNYEAEIFKDIYKNNCYVRGKIWLQILTDYLILLLRSDFQEQEIGKMVELLTPIYLLRVISYFKDIETISVDQLNHQLINQKVNARSNFLSRFAYEN